MKLFTYIFLYPNRYRYIIGIILLSLSFRASAQLTGYGYIARVTVDHNQVSGTADLSNFPVLINHTDPNLRTTGNGGFVTSANGYDIAFTSSDGVTQLDHEIEKYDATTGEYIAWVRIPTLAYDVDTDIYLYYGNASVGTDPSTTNTWDANYQGVWHLVENGNGTANEYNDGTSNNNDGQGGSGNAGKTPNQSTNGKIGNAQDFDGTNDYIDLGFINQTTATVSIWAKREGNSDGNTWQDMIGSQAFGTGGFLLFLHPEATGAKWRTHIAGGVRTIGGSATTSDWHLYTGTVGGSTSRLYVDGMLVSTNTSANMAVSPNKVAIGDDAVGNNNGFFDGLLDEARISNIARSADWIATEFNNQNDPLSFYTVSSPGGVSTNLALWLIADAGIVGSPTVTSWANQRGIADVSTASGDPQLVINSINYNHTIDFDAAGDYFSTANSSFIGNDNPYTKFAVIVSDIANTEQVIIGSDASGNHDMLFTSANKLGARHGGSNFADSPQDYLPGQAHLTSVRYGGAGGLSDQSSLDGRTSVDDTGYSFTDGGSIEIGTRNSGSNLLDGQVAEAIIYTSEVPNADIPKIESYLAIKYGITLDNTASGTAGDYQDSDGTILWDATVNNAHHNDVAGIGKDFQSLLIQQKSMSINSDAMIIMNKGTAFSSNKDFILWGNNNGPITTTTSGVYPKYFYILQRNWKVAVSGSPGTVSVRMIYSNDGIAENYGLLVDSDEDFTTGVTSYTASSISGDTLTFTNVNLADGNFMTLGNGLAGPGGITENMALWVKANAGTSTITDGSGVSSWNDMGAYDNDLSQGNAGFQPAFGDNTTDNINFNPIVDFDGTDDYLLDASGILGSATYNDINVYSVMVTDVVQRSYLFEESCAPLHISVVAPWNDDTYFWDAGGNTEPNGNRLTVDWGGNEGEPYLWSNLYSNTSGQTVSGLKQIIERNGLDIKSDDFASSFTGTNSQFNLASNLTRYHDGKIAEMVIYTGTIDAAQHNQIESYLAIKYGISLDNAAGGTAGDYLDSDGTLLWDADANTGTYHNDVTGIGRDDKSALGQQKSQSINSDALVTMDKGTAFSNDQDFILWGNDNNPVSTTASGADPSFDSRLERTWIAAVSGTPGSVTVTIDFANDGIEENHGLHVDTDVDFSSGATTYIASSISGNTITFDNVSLADGNFFTLGVRKLAPGGVDTGLTLWLKGDTGTKNGGSSVSSGAVDEWEESSGNANVTEITVGTDSPTLLTNGINYNPSLHFDGIDDELLKNSFSADLLFGSQDNTFFYVFQRFAHVAGTYHVFGGWEEDVDPVPRDRAAYFESNADGTLRTDLFADLGRRLESTTDITGKDVLVTVTSDVTSRELFIDGFQEYTENGNSMPVAGNIGSLMIGNRPNSNISHCQQSYTSEYIIYNAALSGTDVDKVETYLAVKYAVTLDNSSGGVDGDYTASDGTTIWDADDPAGYQNEIIAIGRDDKSGLYQKQSRHQNDSLRIYIDALAVDNASNAGTISNDISFVAIGHDGGVQQAREMERPWTVVKSRFEREWKITNTNFDETFSLEIEWDSLGPFDITQIRLLVDDDGDFSDCLVLGPSDGLTFSVGSIIVGGISTAHIPKNESRFITIGSINRGVPLPIELVSFVAKVNQDDFSVELDWQTASEINNDFFTIEKSKDAQDWIAMKRIDGAGNSSERLSYSAVDKSPYSGTSYYRLKQTDYDGQYTYSNIKAVNMTALAQQKIKIYPNPGRDVVTLEGELVELTGFRLYNVVGKDVSSLIRILDKDIKSLKVDISRLPDGVYSIKTTQQVLKFIKK